MIREFQVMMQLGLSHCSPWFVVAVVFVFGIAMGVVVDLIGRVFSRTFLKETR